MATIRCQNLKWRNGRPRWEPGPAVRVLGFKGRDLKDAVGAWLSLADAIAASEQRNAEVASFRASGKTHHRERPQASGRTCRTLFTAWQKTVRWERLAPASRDNYRAKIEVFLADGTFADAPVLALTKPALDGYWQETYRSHGHAMANGIIAAVRAMLSEAERMGWLAANTNPAKGLALPGVPPRVVIWRPDELERLVTTADRIDMPDVGDAVVLAVNTAQRQGDVLRLGDPQIVNGRVRFHIEQSKTGARRSPPLTDMLEQRINTIRTRRRAGQVADLRLAGPLVVRPDGRPHDRFSFAPRWREVRRQASLAMPEQGLPAAPGITAKWFLDLRDTAITRLALADCTMIEISAISGHQLDTITTIMKHYLYVAESFGDAAIDKLKAWMIKEDIAV